MPMSIQTELAILENLPTFAAKFDKLCKLA